MLPGFDATPLKREFKRLMTRAVSPFVGAFLNTTTAAAARDSLDLGTGPDIASAATLDLSSGARVRRVTGTTTVTAFTLDRSGPFFLTADGALPFNVAGVLVYTCNPEDSIVVWEDNDGTQHAAVLGPVATTTSRGPIELATDAESQSGVDTSRAITPASMKAGLNASGSAPIYACRAWANLNATGTPAIRAAGNVASLTDHGTGDLSANFTTSMPDANYAASGAVQREATTGGAMHIPFSYATGSYRFLIRDASNNLRDGEYVNIVIHR